MNYFLSITYNDDVPELHRVAVHISNTRVLAPPNNMFMGPTLEVALQEAMVQIVKAEEAQKPVVV